MGNLPLRKSEDIIDSLKLLNSGKMNAVVAVSSYDLPVQCSMIKKKIIILNHYFLKTFGKLLANFKSVLRYRFLSLGKDKSFQ